MKSIFLVLLASTAFAEITDLRLLDATPTQIRVAFTCPDVEGCKIAVSRRADFATLVEDTNPVLYTNADLVLSRGRTHCQGRYCEVVVGEQGGAAIKTALDGAPRSIALRADYPYYVKAMKLDESESQTIVVRTLNIPLGDVRGDVLGVDVGGFKGVTNNRLLYPEYADPYTGAWIIQRPETLGWGYANSTDTNYGGYSEADCGFAMAPFAGGGCKFSTATGAGWTASDAGTLTNAIRADDNVYVQYSGLTQQPIFFQLGISDGSSGFGSSKVPTVHSTYGEANSAVLSFQNPWLRMFTDSTTGDGEDVEVAFTVDSANPAHEWKTVSLTTSEASYRVFNGAPDTPGDVMVKFGDERFIRPALVYNVSSGTTYSFVGVNATAECNRLLVGDLVIARPSAQDLDAGVAVLSKNCGNTPPQITGNVGLDYGYNGTAGIPFKTISGVNRFNPRFGILVRKKSTTQSSTISIDYALYRAASSRPINMQIGSGGFGKSACQSMTNSEGYTFCMGSSQASSGVAFVYGYRFNSAGDVELKSYGAAQWRTDLYHPNLMANTKNFYGTNINEFPWSDTEAGVFFSVAESTYPNPALGGAVDNRQVIVKGTLNGATPPAADPDGADIGGTMPIAGLTLEVLTPCNDPCTSTSHDQTPYAQIRRMANFSAYDAAMFTNPLWATVQGRFASQYLYATCTPELGCQDSSAWILAWDLGNGEPADGSSWVPAKPGATQQLIGAFNLAKPARCPWCALHTPQNPIKIGGNEDYFVVEPSAKRVYVINVNESLGACSVTSENCTPCPNIGGSGTVRGVEVNSSRNLCTPLMTWTTNCADAGSPVGCVNGDPIYTNPAQPNYKWIRTLQVGDMMSAVLGGSFEVLMLVQKVSNTSGYFMRGIGGRPPNGSNWQPTAHTAGEWFTYSYGGLIDLDNVRIEDGPMLMWDFKNDPDGTNETYTFESWGGNHGFHFFSTGFGPGGVATSAQKTYCLFAPTSVATIFNDCNPYTAKYRGASTTEGFAGAANICNGNACEFHPGMSQVSASPRLRNTWVDLNPLSLIDVNGNGGSGPAASLVSPYTFTYVVNPYSVNVMKPKSIDILAFYSQFPYVFKTPITPDSMADSGYACYSYVANICFSGSLAGRFYYVNHAQDGKYIQNGQTGCIGGNAVTTSLDMCFGNNSAEANSVNQTRFPPTTDNPVDAANMRNFRNRRTISKVNLIPKIAATSNVRYTSDGKLIMPRDNYIIVPPDLPEQSTQNMGTFARIPVPVPAMPGWDNVYVEFGYHDTYQCSNVSTHNCIAQSSTIDDDNPFSWSGETINGVPCSSGCTVMIPGVRRQMMYWRIIARDASNQIKWTGPRNIQAVN